MLEKIKKILGIHELITTYDDEIDMLISSCIEELKNVSISETIIDDDENAQLINTIACYVKAYFQNDRTDTEQYMKMYHNLIFKLQLISDNEEENEKGEVEQNKCGINQ